METQVTQEGIEMVVTIFFALILWLPLSVFSAKECADRAHEYGETCWVWTLVGFSLGLLGLGLATLLIRPKPPTQQNR